MKKQRKQKDVFTPIFESVKRYKADGLTDFENVCKCNADDLVPCCAKRALTCVLRFDHERKNPD